MLVSISKREEGDTPGVILWNLPSGEKGLQEEEGAFWPIFFSEGILSILSDLGLIG